MHDFDLNPPETASIEVFDFGRDVYGNPTANYLILWSNGKTGAEYAGDRLRSRRRVQTGYCDKFSEGALDALRSRFPGTRWKIKPETVDGDRAGGRVSFEAARDFEAEPVPVIFRMEKGDCVAFFPTLPGTNNPWDRTCYAHIGQHSTAGRGYYSTTKKATPEQFAPLKKELESLGYVLDVRKRWINEFDLACFAALGRLKGA